MSFAIEGINYVVSGKSTTDHLISSITEKDCALHRSVTEEKICKSIKEKAPTPTLDQSENVEQTMARLLREYNAKN